METNQGFTFKRRSSNKTINVECLKIKTSEGVSNEDIGFLFKKVGENPLVPVLKGNSKVKKETNKKRLVEGLYNKAKNINKIKTQRTYKRDKKDIDKNKDQSVLEFNVIKKRKTIKLDEDIDLSSNSILVSAPKADCISEEVVKMNIPVIPEKIKSNEIHKLVISNNINDLIKECLVFLKDESKYSKEIVKHCNANYFSDVDYRKEIEIANSKMENVKNEISKWNRIFENEKLENKIVVPAINVDKVSVGVNNEEIQKEFEEKARILQQMNEKLRYFFENAKEKAENLLKNVFGSMEEKNLDAIFLLKAMSKLGR